MSRVALVERVLLACVSFVLCRVSLSHTPIKPKTLYLRILTVADLLVITGAIWWAAFCPRPFDASRWRDPKLRAERVRMYGDLVSRRLKPGLNRRQTWELLGEPDLVDTASPAEGEPPGSRFVYYYFSERSPTLALYFGEHDKYLDHRLIGSG